MKHTLPLALALCALIVLPAQAQELTNGGSGGAVSIGELPQSLAPVSITQSNDLATIVQFNSVSCNNGSPTFNHADNSYIRVFDLDGDHGLVSFRVIDIDWAVESAASSTGGGQPIVINVYQLANGLPPTFANLGAPIGTTGTINFPDMALALVNTPVASPDIDATTHDLVVEVFTPDGQATGETFFIGSNAGGQTAPSFIAAAACGIADPADIGAIGFPNMHLIMQVNGDDTPLPVELVDFTAFVEQNEVTLNWQTATETDNSGFEVQVKQGDTFQALAFVDGYGTTLEAQNYSYRVTDLDPGTHTFRLKQIDFDGQFEYSPEVQATVEVVDHYFLTEAYPNPFNPSATIRFAVDESQPVVMALYNMHGQRVRTVYQGVPAADEMQTVHINAGGLPSGMYMVQLVGNTFRASQSVTLLK